MPSWTSWVTAARPAQSAGTLNIAPTAFIDVVTARTKDREIVGPEMPMRWGLIPTWWKKPRKDAGDLQRARQTVAEKPMLIGRPTSRNVEDNRQNSMFFPLPFHHGRLISLFSYGRSDE
jgi:putative SOS response-associated peptidase YedK